MRPLHDLAVAEKRIIVSFMTTLGQRAYTCPERPPGIVILKFKPRNASEVGTRLQEAIAEVRGLSGKLVIVQRTIVRVRVLD
jgi:hypothetical protein